MLARVTRAEGGPEAKYRAKFAALKAELTKEFCQKDVDMWDRLCCLNVEM